MGQREKERMVYKGIERERENRSELETGREWDRKGQKGIEREWENGRLKRERMGEQDRKRKKVREKQEGRVESKGC